MEDFSKNLKFSTTVQQSHIVSGTISPTVQHPSINSVISVQEYHSLHSMENLTQSFDFGHQDFSVTSSTSFNNSNSEVSR